MISFYDLAHTTGSNKPSTPASDGSSYGEDPPELLELFEWKLRVIFAVRRAYLPESHVITFGRCVRDAVQEVLLDGLKGVGSAVVSRVMTRLPVPPDHISAIRNLRPSNACSCASSQSSLPADKDWGSQLVLYAATSPGGFGAGIEAASEGLEENVYQKESTTQSFRYRHTHDLLLQHVPLPSSLYYDGDRSRRTLELRTYKRFLALVSSKRRTGGFCYRRSHVS